MKDLKEEIAIAVVTPLCKSSISPEEVADAVVDIAKEYSNQQNKELLEALKQIRDAKNEKPAWTLKDVQYIANQLIQKYEKL